MKACGNLFDEFRKKAELVSAKISRIQSVSEAIDYGAALVNTDGS